MVDPGEAVVVTDRVPGEDVVAALARAGSTAGAVADGDRAERMVAVSRQLVDMARAGQLDLGEEASGLVSGVVGMIGATEAAMKALAAQRTALLAVAAAVVEANPGTMVPLLPDVPVTGLDRDHARRALVADVAVASGASEVSTATLMHTAGELVGHLPATLTAMAAGVLGDQHARNVVRHAEGLPPEAMGGYEADVLGRLGADRSPSGVGRTARAARERCHPRTLRERHERAWADRSVTVDGAADGMAWLTAYLPAVQAHAIFDKITGVARALGEGDGEKRRLSQRRADALTALVLDPPEQGVMPAAGAGAGDVHLQEPGVTKAAGVGGVDLQEPGATTAADTGGIIEDAGERAADPDDPGALPPWALDPALHALRPTVAVTVPVLTLLGDSDEPGHLEGYGPIDPDTARVLAANAPSFIRLLTHPETGAVLSVGRERYTVPADLRTWLRIRDEVCRFPACRRRAGRADLDHTVPFREGGHRGSTAAGNLAHLCPTHHRLKHKTLWSARQHADGRLNWTSPTGRTHTTDPAVDLRADE